MFVGLIVLCIIASSIWVLVDAETHKVPADRHKPYSVSNGSAAWFIGCLLLWIVGFPWYLIARSASLAERPSAPVAPVPPNGTSSFCSTCGTALSAGASFCQVCGSRAPVVANGAPSSATQTMPVGPPSWQPVLPAGRPPLPSLDAEPPIDTPVPPVAPPPGEPVLLPGASAQMTPGRAPSSWQTTGTVSGKTSRSRGWVVGAALVVVIVAVVAVMGLVHISKANQDALKRADAAKEGLHSLQIGVQSYAVDHNDNYPDVSLVTEAGLVDSTGGAYVDYWPSNPYTGLPMQQGTGPGDYSYKMDGTTFQMTVYGPNGESVMTVP